MAKVAKTAEQKSEKLTEQMLRIFGGTGFMVLAGLLTTNAANVYYEDDPAKTEKVLAIGLFTGFAALNIGLLLTSWCVNCAYDADIKRASWRELLRQSMIQLAGLIIVLGGYAATEQLDDNPVEASAFGMTLGAGFQLTHIAYKSCRLFFCPPGDDKSQASQVGTDTRRETLEDGGGDRKLFDLTT